MNFRLQVSDPKNRLQHQNKEDLCHIHGLAACDLGWLLGGEGRGGKGDRRRIERKKSDKAKRNFELSRLTNQCHLGKKWEGKGGG